MHLSRRQRRRLVVKYRDGAEITSLSTEFGVTVGQVRSLLEDAGEDLPPGERDRGGLIGVHAPAASS